MSDFPRVPSSARSIGLPFHFTITVLLCQRVYAWPGAVTGVVWTLLVLIWIASIVDAFTARFIPDAKWRELFK